jgi:hypothetical protein
MVGTCLSPCNWSLIYNYQFQIQMAQQFPYRHYFIHLFEQTGNPEYKLNVPLRWKKQVLMSRAAAISFPPKFSVLQFLCLNKVRNFKYKPQKYNHFHQLGLTTVKLKRDCIFPPFISGSFDFKDRFPCRYLGDFYLDNV